MRVLSGIQPTGSLHIGNYLAAIKQWVELQDKNECVFPIVDLHSLTIPYDPKKLQENILEAAIAYLAAGINPQKCILFIQSHIKEHSELCWLLNTVCPMGDLERMTQYKEKSKQFKKDVNAGLFTYPILMAADILLYKTEAVPVGKDQVQHTELARTIARRFNKRFGNIFPEPRPMLSKTGAKILSLNDPKKKMSKSLGPQSYVSLFDEPNAIERKIMSSVTDTDKKIKYNISRKPGISNLLAIYSLFADKEIKDIEKEFEGKGYAEFKKSLSELLINKLEPFRRKRKELLLKKDYIEDILNEGAKRAEVLAKETMKEVKEKMGL